ncbi:hypothetical protein [Enterobacter roggenkampii]
MNPITLSEMSDEDEEVKIISSYEPQDDEIAIVFDSSKITGGNALDFFQFTKQSHSNVKVYGDSNGVSYLQLNSITLALGTFFATSVMIPFLVNLVSNYIQKKIDNFGTREGANKQVISSQADSLIKISRIWADFFPANTSNQPI